MAEFRDRLPADETALPISNKTPAYQEQRKLIESITASYAAHGASNRRTLEKTDAAKGFCVNENDREDVMDKTGPSLRRVQLSFASLPADLATRTTGDPALIGNFGGAFGQQSAMPCRDN